MSLSLPYSSYALPIPGPAVNVSPVPCPNTEDPKFGLLNVAAPPSPGMPE